jgi:hypothetical protein
VKRQEGTGNPGRRSFVKGAALAAGAGSLVPLGGIAPAIAAGRQSPAPRAAAAADAVTVRPGDPRYADLVSGLNQRWTSTPDHVRLATSTEQVVAAVQAAVRDGRRISVRSGGHCYEDFVYNADVDVVIDLSEMRGVSYDASMRAFAVEPGTQLLELYETLYKEWGVTIPGGTSGTVGVGGLVPGGGYGLLSRRDGLAADHLHAIEIVVVDKNGKARAVVATREPDDPRRDLWWAHTGAGGGSFGIITRFWFRSPSATGTDPAGLLPRPPASVLVSQLGIPWSALTETGFHRLLKNFGEWFKAHTTPGTPHGDAFSFLVLNHVSAGGIGVVSQFAADTADARSHLDDYLTALVEGVVPRSYVTPARELPWLRAAHLVATSGVVTDPTLRAEHKSAYLRDVVPDTQAAAIYRHLTDTGFTNPNAMMVLYSYGGKINTVPKDATATAQRASVLKLLYQAFWYDPADDAENIGWLRTFHRDVYAATGGVPTPDGLNDGCYVNYPDIDLGDPRLNTSGQPWHTLYYQTNYPRLQQIKGRWDPLNTFRHGQSVRLPGDHT